MKCDLPQKTDVAIVGGGPAGAMAALVLARLGLQAVVVEAALRFQRKPGECLPPQANRLLQRLGLAGVLEGHRESHGIRSVWGSGEPFERSYLFSPYGPGWHLDRQQFDRALAGRAVQAGALWFSGRRVVGIGGRQGGWELAVRGPSGVQCVSARFVMDATGRAAYFARRQGAVCRRDDRLVGHVQTWRSEGGEPLQDSYTLVEAVRDGWWYSAPLPGGSVVSVFFTDHDLVPQARRPGGLSRRLADAHQTSARLQHCRVECDHRVRVRSACTARLSPVVTTRWLAVGDAALSFDPLSSHGISTALSTGFYGAHAAAGILDRQAEAIDAYRLLLDQVFGEYRRRYDRQYSLERRWPGSEFWNRRRPRPDLESHYSEQEHVS